jgi:hypothetical protein
MKRYIVCLIVIAFFSMNAHAKKSGKIWQEFERLYAPAEPNYGLERAVVAPDPSKWRGFVVLMKGGLPAERAAFYINWEDYDYRGVTIEGEKVKTRRGSIYTFMQKGDVMAIAGIDKMGRSLYLKLITPDVYIPENRQSDKRHSRVTNMINFKLPKDVCDSDDAERAMQLLEEWFKPFGSLDEALEFGFTLKQQ